MRTDHPHGSEALIAALGDLAAPSARDEVRRFVKGVDSLTEVMGVPIGSIFPIAKTFTDLPLAEVEALLDDNRYEVRMAAVAVMDFKARRPRITDAERRALFDLYLRKHDRINNWGLVDRAAPHVIGEYLVERDRSQLDRLAQSSDPHERRTALVASHAFIKRGEVGDLFRIASILADDDDAYVQKAIASWTREAGKKDPTALVRFLTENKDRLPRSTLSAAARQLPEEVKRSLLS